MGQNIGTIDLGLDINQRSFNRQLQGISRGAERSVRSIFGGLGKKIGAALGVTAVAKFTKSCLDLGSDLAEVQNVVDVTFGSMREEINEFAKTAITQFGISETSAKQYTSTMGAMLKSMGIGTQQAVKMSQVMAGLSADMASFYNLNADDAFYKIRAGISGETEPLKQLGINMSVANLEAYALSQGISKAYNKMSQQEQTLLRYNYLLSVTADAQGDFARTSDSWANQTRILSEQFNALKATLGQGLIAAFTPIVRGLNIVIGKLRVAAGYFKSFMELIFGAQSVSGGTGMSSVAEDVSNIISDASDASGAVEGIGDAAKSAGKKAKGALASFDELNQLNISDDSDSDVGSGALGLEDMGGVVDVDLGETVEQTDTLTTMFDGVIKQFNTMKDLFVKGFKISFETVDLDGLNQAIANIKTGFINVFGDGSILSSFTNMLNSMALSAGATVGAYASIGVTIATNLIGGIGNYLNQNSQYIKDRLIGIFDARAEISNMWTKYITTWSDIFSVFGGETGQQITANIVGMFSNGFLGILELATKLGRDIMKCITQPIVDNKESFKQALEGTLEVISEVTGTVKDLITETMKKALEVYDEYLAPAFEKIESGISKIVKALTDAYNTYIQPTLLKMAKSWDDFYNESLKPVIDKALEVFGKLVDGVAEIWDKTLAPFVAWAIDTLAPCFATAFENISEAFKTAGEIILGIVDDLLTIFDGLIDFVVGVFTGDWKRAWEGIKTIFKGIVDTFQALIKEPIDKALEWVKGAFTRSWTTAWNNVKTVFGNAFNGLKTLAKSPLNYIIELINKAIRGINKVTGTVNKIPGVSIGSIPEIPKLAKGGVVDQPTLAMIGEAGKEAVVPLQNNTEWTGQVASLLANALLPLIQGNTSGGDINRDIVISIDGVELVRAFLPTLIREANRQGVKIGG